jgi:hypothetical protein
LTVVVDAFTCVDRIVTTPPAPDWLVFEAVGPPDEPVPELAALVPVLVDEVSGFETFGM